MSVLGTPLIEPDMRIACIRLSECHSSIYFMMFAIWLCMGKLTKP